MKILGDENMDVEFVDLFDEHDAHHVIRKGWKAFTNGSLLSLAYSESFNVFISADKNMPYQQSMKGRHFFPYCPGSPSKQLCQRGGVRSQPIKDVSVM